MGGCSGALGGLVGWLKETVGMQLELPCSNQSARFADSVVFCFLGPPSCEETFLGTDAKTMHSYLGWEQEFLVRVMMGTTNIQWSSAAFVL